MKNIDNKARVLQEVVSKLGWSSDVTSLIERVKQIDKGLVKEDEFIYLLNWYPNCRIVHKLDQSTIPDSKRDEIAIPDVLAIFEIDGEVRPYLIEIKSTEKDKLSWSEKYVNKLKAYSTFVNIPLLVAWKCSKHKFENWLLFSIEDFQKPNENYKMDYLEAFKWCRLSKYTKDYMVSLPENFAMEIVFKKSERVKVETDGDTLDVFFEGLLIRGRKNAYIDKFNTGLFALMLALGFDEKIEETETHIKQVWKPYNTNAFMHTVILRLIKIISRSNINWSELIQKGSFPIKYDTMFENLKDSIDTGLVNHIVFSIPNTKK